MSFKQKKQYTKRSDYWNTPSELYNNLIGNGYEDYNPEGSIIQPFDNDVSKYHGLKIYINPPFSLLGNKEMLDTIKGLLRNDNKVLLLMPARTDTKYFHEFLKLKPKIYFIKGRLSFNDKGSAPFPSILLQFGTKDYNEYFVIEKHGKGLTSKYSQETKHLLPDTIKKIKENGKTSTKNHVLVTYNHR